MTNKLRKAYFVNIGMSGYLPDITEVFTSRRQAQAFAVSEARLYRELGYKVNGNREIGYEICRDDSVYCIPIMIDIVMAYISNEEFFQLTEC